MSSNTSPSGCGGLISASGVAASRLASIASMSSWLLDTTGSGAAGGGGGAGLGAAGLAEGAIADGGISFIAGTLAAGAAAGASGLAGAGGGPAGFSAAAGFASSSAMMRRIDARISSIEGSWTFAGCVISDSTSKAFYTKPQRICRFRI